MRALVLEAPRRIVFRDDLPEPELLDARDAIVEVTHAGLCGSDLHPYLGREAVRAGTIPGHELVGRILAVGAAVEGLSPGDRVLAPFTTSCGACAPCRRALSARCVDGALLGWRPPEGMPGRGVDGAQAERVRIPLARTTLVRVPDEIDDLAALLLGDNFTTGWFGATGAGAGPVLAIAVVGCGAVGLSAIAAARHLGAETILAVDPVPERRAIAETLGARAVAPGEAPRALAELGAHLREGAAGVVEAVGSPEAQRLALDLVRPGGAIAAVGVHTAPFAFTPGEAYDSNLTYRAGRAPVRSLLDSLLPEVAAGRIRVPVEAIIGESERTLEEGADAYRRFAERAGGVRKIVFRP